MFILWKELVTSFPVQLGIIAGLLHSPVVSFTVSPPRHGEKKKKSGQLAFGEEKKNSQTLSNRTATFTAIIWISSLVYLKKDNVDRVDKLPRLTVKTKETAVRNSSGHLKEINTGRAHSYLKQ